MGLLRQKGFDLLGVSTAQSQQVPIPLQSRGVGVGSKVTKTPAKRDSLWSTTALHIIAESVRRVLAVSATSGQVRDAGIGRLRAVPVTSPRHFRVVPD